MVDIEEVLPDNDDDAVVVEEISVSEERRLDAEAIEHAASQMTRPSAKLQLESLAKKLRKESEALARMERSKAQNQQQATTTPSSDPETAAAESTPSSTAKPEPATPIPAKPSAPPPVAPSAHYTPIDKFAFDSGSYEAPFVTLYVDLPGVGSIPKENVTCQFTKGSFDFIVKDLNGKTYRLFKDNLEKEIDPDKSKLVIKAQKVLIKLHKIKQGEYGSGYEYWSQLTDKKKAKKNKANTKDNPQASIMELMKEMYDDGDDNMKKIIGETMMKQQRGEMGDGMGGMGMGMGGMPGMGGGLDDF